LKLLEPGSMTKTVHRAKYVLAEPDLLLQNAAVYISEPGRISRVEPWDDEAASSETDVIDWGAAMIMPGLVNAHAHLELTSLGNQLTQFSSFTDWIFQLVSRRRAWTDEDFLKSIREGVKRSITAGTTLVADISSSATNWGAIEEHKLRRVVFKEVMGLSSSQAGEIISRFQNLWNHADSRSLLSYGVSPHAPYTSSPELYRRAAELARSRRILLTTHVAETRSELEFLETGEGEFRDFLNAMSALPPEWNPPRLAPIAYLDSLDVLGPFSLLAHCNYVDTESMGRILGSRSSVVFCPRSHHFFGHQEHPVRQFLDSGVNVALGTDSLASNTSLSMIDEMRFLFEKRRDIKAEEIFRAATLNGAAALDFGGSLGRLRQGYLADMTVLEVPPNLGSRQLLSHVLEGAGECIGTIVHGKIAWQKPESTVPEQAKS
jgi:cytosine/adenosine deaminase-related metal-dependent hydrolase